MSDFNSLVQYTVENISRPVKYIIYKLTEFIRVVDKFVFRQVPTGAASGYATIEQIEGNTVKFNQLVQNGDFSQAALLNNSAFYGLSGNVTYEDKLTFTCSTSSTALKGYYAPVSSLTIGHRYLVCATLSKHTGDNTNWVLVGFLNDAASVTPIDSNNSYDDDVEFLAYSITELPVQCDKVGARIRNFSPAGATLTAKNLNIIDLTAIFTSGNEPDTMDEFVSWCTQNRIDLEKALGYNAGELLSVKMSGMQTEDSSQQTLDTMTLDVTTITGINPNTNTREVMFASGMNWLSDSIHDIIDLVNGEATVKCGYYEISGGEDWEAVSLYTGVYRIPSRTPSNVANMTGASIGKCSHYVMCPTRTSISAILATGQFGWNTSYYLHIKDKLYANVADFKAYLAAQYAAGTPVTIIYPITPITYTDLQDGNGNPLNPRYKVEQGGTEQVLPVNTSTPTTVAPTLSTIYKKNI